MINNSTTYPLRLVEEFLRHNPELINLKGSEINLSLLHFAAVRDKLEVADFLLKQVCLSIVTLNDRHIEGRHLSKTVPISEVTS